MASGSIVDYLNSKGQDSSYQARKRLAEQYGISGYSGTAAQNTQLLGSLRSGSSAPSSSQPGPTFGMGVQGQASPGTSNISKSPVITAGGGGLAGPGAVDIDWGPSSSSSGSPVITQGQGGGPGVSSSSTKSSNYLTDYSYNPFSVSGRTSDYADKLDDLENNKPGPYNSRWQSKIDGLVDSIMGRPKFETDDVFDSDLYKTYREQYINQGQRAMRDAAANAAGLTGGYGSTYSAAAGQQAYDNYLNQLNDRTLDIYDRVYNQYLQEGQELYNQLGMLNNQDSIEYGRYRDDVGDYYRDLDYYAGRYDQSYNADFGQWQADQAAQQWAEEYAYQKTQDALAQQNWQTQFDYQKEQDAWERQMQEQQLALQAAKAASGGSGGGGRRSSGSSKKKSSSKREISDGTRAIAATVVGRAEREGWDNLDAYNYVMQLGERGKITNDQVDDILELSKIDEKKALDEIAQRAEDARYQKVMNKTVWGTMR